MVRPLDIIVVSEPRARLTQAACETDLVGAAAHGGAIAGGTWDVIRDRRAVRKITCVGNRST